MFGIQLSLKLEVIFLVTITSAQLYLVSRADKRAIIGGLQLLTDIFLLTWALSVFSSYAVLPLYLLLVSGFTSSATLLDW